MTRMTPFCPVPGAFLLRRLAGAMGLALLAAGCAAPTVEMPQRRAVATEQLPPMKVFAPARPTPPARSNASIAQDFMDLTFRMESGRAVERFNRFEVPVRVAMTGTVPASARPDLQALLQRLRTEAAIDIAEAATPEAANVTVQFLPRARMQALVPHAACFFVPNVSGWEEFRAHRRSQRVDWTQLHRRDRIAIFIPADVAPQEVRDCLHEELAQALGPLNDLYRLSDSVFNDDNFHTVLTGFDMLVLRATYALELHSGMTPAQVAARLPAILARLNPAGRGGAAGPAGTTPRAWVDAIEAALGPRTPPEGRRFAAHGALAIASAQGWTDNRRAFSHFAVARLSLAAEVESAVMHFAAAAQIYRALPDGAIHLAHVDMQMAAFALSAGQADEAIALADRALPAVARAENAALLSTLMMIKSEALALAGRDAEARAVMLDSLGWARYGFGSDDLVHQRKAEIAALVPTAGRMALTAARGSGG